MKEISIDRTVWSGFSLTARHPGAFALWVLVDLVLGQGPYALLMALLGPNFLSIVRHGDVGASFIETVLTGRILGGFAPMISSLILYAILYGAVFRAVLRPQERRFGYVRIGRGELVLAALMAMFYIGFVAFIACGLFVNWLISLAITAVAPAVGAVISLLLTVALIAAVVWLLARLSMVMPMSFAAGRFKLAEAWSLTRGQLKQLLLLAVLLVLLALAVVVVIFAAVAVSGTVFLTSFGDVDALRAFLEQSTDDIIRNLTPWGLAAAAFSALVSTFGFVVFAAPWAEAYREIAEAEPGPAPAEAS